MKHSGLFLFLALFLVAEIFILGASFISLIIYVSLLTIISLLYSSINYPDKHAQLFYLLLIIPVFRIAELFLPIQGGVRIMILSTILASLAIYLAYITKTKMKFRPNSKRRIGLSLVVSMTIALMGSRLIESPPLLWYVLPLAVLSEEIFLRGVIMEKMMQCYKVHYAILFNALLSGILYASFGLNIALFHFFLGIALSASYACTRSWLVPFVMRLIVATTLYLTPYLHNS
jgi:membrane protease YdiL (CAAX protease family)